MSTLMSHPPSVEEVLDLDLEIAIFEDPRILDNNGSMTRGGCDDTITCATLGPRCTVSTYSPASRCPDCY